MAICAGFSFASVAAAAGAPDWMRAQLNGELPPHDEKTVAVVLYAETIFTVQANGKMSRLDRNVTKILRPDGAARGVVRAEFDPQSPILRMQAWSIPPNGKDYEVKEKDAIETPVQVTGGELISDLKTKVMRIPAATVGSVIGFEIEQEVHPNLLLEEWGFQDVIPVREAHLTLSLPHGWAYRARWVNHAEEPPAETAPAHWSWTLRDVAPIRLEARMPPWRGISSRVLIGIVPPNGQQTPSQSWDAVGAWYGNLTRERLGASPDMQRKVRELTADAGTMLEKMKAIAHFVQTDIRYVAIELGIGDFQPHSAADVFAHRYGDCKDKVTLMRSMLKEIGIDSHYVLINTERGSIIADTPPNLDFNHAILAIDLPADVDASGLDARNSGTGPPLLFFDPTDELTAFGSLSGALQANYGLLVSSTGGALMKLPQLPVASTGVDRTATFVLDEAGTLSGDVHEVHRGDRAAGERYVLRSVDRDTDRIKPVEATVGASLASYQILKAVLVNAHSQNQPLEWKYTLEAHNYAKGTGEVVLVRPRVLGSFSSALMETKEPRQNPIEFGGPEHDSDVFEITLPQSYTVDELPPPVDLEEPFASYHSKTVVVGHVMRCTRIFEIKQLDVPVSSADELKEFFRHIEGDERNSAVLLRASN